MSKKKLWTSERYAHNFSYAQSSSKICAFGVMASGKEFIEDYTVRGDVMQSDITGTVKEFFKGIKESKVRYKTFTAPNPAITILARASYEGSDYLMELFTFSVITELYRPLWEMCLQAGRHMPHDFDYELRNPIDGENDWNQMNGLIDMGQKAVIVRTDCRCSVAPYTTLHSYPMRVVAEMCGVPSDESGIVRLDDSLKKDASRAAYRYLKETFFS